MASDLDQLIEMGFDKERAELAVKKTGGCRSRYPRLLPRFVLSDDMYSARGA
jgi:hypothetical protein